jgi:hypothetical protein
MGNSKPAGRVSAATLTMKVRLMEAARTEGIDLDPEEPMYSQWATCEALALTLPAADAKEAKSLRRLASGLAKQCGISRTKLARIRHGVEGWH